ncbi:hypothetical protein V7x_17620 [Crateriforma conspicua]|uniref:Uncharacterized protein n=1 Tax=Crateriforma conspicua TaxID=2527996 RepID=A0A5C6FV72_9PLAN|nr:hypothetical protein V7x_17620 [Crateriforma conspicua]
MTATGCNGYAIGSGELGISTPPRLSQIRSGGRPDQRRCPIAVTVEGSLAEPVYFVRQADQRRLPSNDDRESVD